MNMVGHAVYAYQPAMLFSNDSGNDPMEVKAVYVMQGWISSEGCENNVM